MKGKLLISLVLVAGFFVMTTAEKFVRYNQVGYFPDAGKKIIVMSDKECSKDKWSIKDSVGKELLSGELGISIAGATEYTPMSYNYKIDFSSIKTSGEYTFVLVGTDDVKLTIGDKLYDKKVESVLRYLRVVRSSDPNSLDHKPSHFGDSSCVIFRKKGKSNTDGWEEDKEYKKVDLTGGWFDAFTYAKTTITEAHITYFLLRSYQENPKLFTKKYSKTEFVDVLDEAKWGLDYLMKLMPDNKEFIIAAGGFEDNEEGTRLPDEDVIDGKRRCYSAYSLPQMGSVSAALALGANVFKAAGKVELANKYGEMAAAIFKAAGKTTDAVWLEEDYDIFKDDSKYDNMLLGAVELYKLTGDSIYKTAVNKYVPLAKSIQWPLYANQVMPAHYANMNNDPRSKATLKEELSGYFEKRSETGNIWGVPLEFTFSSTYAFMEIASHFALYGKAESKPEYEAAAIDVLDFMFGLNSWGKSFISLKELNSVRNIYSPIYILQTHLYPEGAVPVGPLDNETHLEESKWCAFDPRVQPEHKFNTKEVKYYDHADDYMCSEVYAYGVADALFFLTVISSVNDK